MDVLGFKKTIIDTCIGQCKTAILLILIIAALLIKDIIYYCTTKNNDGFSLLNLLFGGKIFKNRFTTKGQIFLKVVAIVALLLLTGKDIFPAYRDISKQQYICVSGQCTYEPVEQQNPSAYECVRVETEEGVLLLKLPVNWDTERLFIATQQGELYYGKESKILLSFNPHKAEDSSVP